MPNPMIAPLLRRLSKLAYPKLFLLMAALFAFDLLVPDFIPFIDEILLGVGTLLLSRITTRGSSSPTKPPLEGEFKH